MADNFGLKIGLEGEKEFKKALSDINQSFKVLGSEMKVVQSQFDKNDDSVEALTSRNQVLGKEIDAQKKKIETLRKALENASTSFGENDRRTQQWQIQLNNAQAALNNMERELDQNQKAIDSMGSEMQDAAQQTDKFGDEIDDAADKTDKASGKLEKVGSVLKGLAVTAGAAVAAAGAALAGLTKSFLDLAESTREYREDQAKLDAAFTTAGFTAEQAGEAYTGFYAILGEEDRSVEAVNHLAKLCSTEEELAQWTDIAAGVWATFGNSLPIEGLTEAANETAKTGTITGQLADALNWAGVNEEAFQSALDGCSSEQERAALITDTLNGLYQEAAENYKTLNGDVMEAQRAQALLTDAYAQLGAIVEPIMTTLKTMAADVLTAMILNALPVLIAALPEIINGIVTFLLDAIWDKVSGWISGIWDGILGFFGINSPSKEMAWVGEMLVEGLAGSIEDNGGQAVKAAEGMSEGINGVMQDLAKDMTTALLTDFSVKGSVENAMTSAASGGAGKSGFVLQLNIGTFNNYTNEDIRQLTNEIMVTAGQFAKRKGVVFA